MNIIKYLPLLVYFLLSLGQNLISEDVLSIYKSDSAYFKLEPIDVTASRILNSNPISVTIIGKSELELSHPNSPLNNAFRNTPGLFALSDFNNVQDARISIRGFGSRSNFGIRGIKILIDGIPESTPDGQGQMDNISINYIDKINIFRGPTSLLFGNASGGAINLISKQPENRNFFEASMIINSFYDRSLTFLINRKNNILNWNLQTDIQYLKGHRDHSSALNSILNLQLKIKTKYFETFQISINYLNNPYALDPGALTLEQKNFNRTAARLENQLFDSRESVIQNKFTISAEKFINNKTIIKTNIWTIDRYFENKLPFQDGGQVALKRRYYGIISKFIHHFSIGRIDNKILIGTEINNQYDTRKRFDNLLGNRGDIAYRAKENFLMKALFFQHKMTLKNHYTFACIRYDNNQTIFKNQLINNDSLDYQIKHKNISPLFGYKYKLNRKIFFFTNYSTHFETPTLYELGNNIILSKQFEFISELKPQTNSSGELGILFQNNELEHAEAIFFISRSENEIVPYEIENEPGRSYYKNVGITERNGIELALRKNIIPGFNLKYVHTLTNFKFKDYNNDGINLSGNYLPLIPRQFGKLNLLFHTKRDFNINLEIYYAGKYFFDDINNTFQKPYLLTNIKIKRKFKLYGLNPEIFCYINNVFNIEYNSNIRMNAWGGRYYEPGPTRNYSIGFQI